MFLFLRQSTSYPSCVSCLLHAPRCVHSKTDLFWETIEQQISVGLCVSLSTDIEDSCLQLVLLFKAWAWTGEAMFVRPIFLHKMVLETGPQNHVGFHMRAGVLPVSRRLLEDVFTIEASKSGLP